MRRAGNRARGTALAARLAQRERSTDQADALCGPQAGRTRAALLAQTTRGRRWIIGAGGRNERERRRLNVESGPSRDRLAAIWPEVSCEHKLCWRGPSASGHG